MRYLKLYEEYIPSGSKEKQIDLLKKLGYNIVESIGGGYYGHCYLSDKNSILKITGDYSDVVSAYMLLNKKSEYLCDIYSVFYVTNAPYGNSPGTYIIEMENCPRKDIKIKKLKNAFKYFDYPKKNILYNLHPNSYVRDFVKIQKEASEKGIRIDLQNSGNFGIKNGHLCAFDLGVSSIFDVIDKKCYRKYEDKIEKVTL